MKNSTWLFLLLLLSTCSYNNLRFGERYKQHEQHQEQVSASQSANDKPEQSPNELTRLETDLQLESNEYETTIASSDESYIPASKAIRTLERFQQEHLDHSEKAQDIVAEIKEISAQSKGRYEKQVTMGIIFLCGGGFFLLVSILAFFKYSSILNDPDTGTAEGCIASIFNSFFFLFMAILSGIAGVVLVVLGIIFIVIASAKLSKEENK